MNTGTRPFRRRLRRIAVAAVLAAATPGCHAATSSLSGISLSYPSGERSLVVPRDGEARLHYGAAPQNRILAAGTFDIDELYRRLRPFLLPVEPAERRPPGPYGTVTLRFEDGRTSAHVLYDADVASALLDAACAAVDPAGPAADLVDAACSRAHANSP